MLTRVAPPGGAMPTFGCGYQAADFAKDGRRGHLWGRGRDEAAGADQPPGAVGIALQGRGCGQLRVIGQLLRCGHVTDVAHLSADIARIRSVLTRHLRRPAIHHPNHHRRPTSAGRAIVACLCAKPVVGPVAGLCADSVAAWVGNACACRSRDRHGCGQKTGNRSDRREMPVDLHDGAPTSMTCHLPSRHDRKTRDTSFLTAGADVLGGADGVINTTAPSSAVTSTASSDLTLNVPVTTRVETTDIRPPRTCAPCSRKASNSLIARVHAGHDLAATCRKRYGSVVAVLQSRALK